MAQNIFPIILKGDNLGNRHRHYNSLLNVAYEDKVPISSIKSSSEQSVLDHLFKIDAAAKHRDVEYIISELKNLNIIYANRAMKPWLIDGEYSHIFNPDYLETELYPAMTTTAVTKMKHLLQLKLKDPARCEQFYQYYKEKNFDEAFRYLSHCSKEIILNEAPTKFDKMTPFRLKSLSETCPEIAKIFYEKLYTIQDESTVKDRKVLSNYLENQQKYFKNIKFLLKVNGDIFLDIAEKCYHEYLFGRFNGNVTKYVMRNYKERFDRKPELYTAWFLNIETLAKCLSPEDIKETVLKLARASYLSNWFSYKNVEPLIKRLNFEERTAFKKQVFVDKIFGDAVEKCPYEMPSPPELWVREEKTVLDDYEHDPCEYECVEVACDFVGRGMLKRKCMKRSLRCMAMPQSCIIRKTSLDLLFDRFRFVGFDKALFDLRKEMKAATMKRRQNMMLVLISKSAGRVENLYQLFQLLTMYKNEPENLRATIVRSLVRRCSAWRLPENIWDALFSFGRGLGLDGTPSTVACKEGIHAVIIRSIVQDLKIETAVWDAFIKEFSTLKEYSLNGAERKQIITKLPTLIMEKANKEPDQATARIENVLEVLDAYKIKPDKCPDLIDAIATAAKTAKDGEHLLRRLFNLRIARKQLFRENFDLIQNEASYLNALRHDLSILTSGEHFEKLIKEKKLSHDRFLRSLVLYFNEKDGLAERYFSLMIKYAEESSEVNLARAYVILSAGKFLQIMLRDSAKKSKERRFAAELKACAHLSVPLIDIDAEGWKNIGAKAVANRVLTCPDEDVEKYVTSLMAEPKTQRVGFVLSLRIGKEASTLATICEKRPRLGLKICLLHSKNRKLDESVWDIVIPVIPSLSISSEDRSTKLQAAMMDVKIVPEKKKALYVTRVFEFLSKGKRYDAMPMLCHIELMLPEIEETVVENIIKHTFDEELKLELLKKKDYNFYNYHTCLCLRVRIIAKYLLLCTSEDQQKKRWDSIGMQFMNRIIDLWQESENKSDIQELLQDFLLALKYKKVFTNTDYVSVLPVFELIINKLQSFLPLYQHYTMYVCLHLTMLYFKTVRQAIKNNRELFENLPKKQTEATEIVGRIFGRYIAKEVVELTEKYFDSIRIAYREELDDYLTSNYFRHVNVSKRSFLKNIIYGILDCENDKAHLLAQHIYSTANLGTKEDEEILEILKKSKSIEVRFFLRR